MLIYLVQSSLSMILFFIIYRFAFSPMTFYHWNRVFLIGSVVLSLLLPLSNCWMGNFWEDISPVPWQAIADEIVVYANTPGDEILPVNQISAIPWFWLVYAAGFFIVFCRMVFGLVQIYRLYYTGKRAKDGHFTIVETQSYHLPFSFFHLIFLNRIDHGDRDTRAIIQHEQIHARQWHSFDILLLECIQTVYWFLPVISGYKKALRQIHECLADEEICRSMTIKDYVQVLLKEQQYAMQVNLGNQFFQSQIKQRLHMMTKKKNHRYFRLLYALILPVTVGLSLAFSSPDLRPEIPMADMATLFVRDTTPAPTPPTPPKAPKAAKAPKAPKEPKRSGMEDAPIPPPPPPAPEAPKAVPPPPPPSPSSREIFKKVEEMPRYKHEACEAMSLQKEKYDCAQGKFMEYLTSHLVYPEAAKKDSIEGSVVVQFVIDKKGSMVDFKIIRDIGYGCGQAVETSLQDLLGKPGVWIPGKQLGKAVEVLYTLPVKFKLD